MFKIWTLVFILGNGEMIYYPDLTESECDLAASALEHIESLLYLACETTIVNRD